MMKDYEIGDAFQAIEDELIASMIRNMKRHRVEEVTEDKQWSMWQAEQLKSLNIYRRENAIKYTGTFKDMNESIDGIIAKARETGGLEEEINILEGMKRGFKPGKIGAGGITHEQFFKLNTHKLEALSRATVSDMKNAQIGILRMSNDKYRQIIFKAQMYANTGAGTYAKAVDMATKDYLEAGINCIEYKNGARHTPANYSRMCIRTASKRAKLTGEGEKRKEYGISTVIINKRGNPCPLCMPFVGKVFIDDVWSGGTAKDGPYPLLSSAIAAGLFHPNCKDGHTTYFPGDDVEEATDTDKQKADDAYQGEQEAAYASRQFDRFSRLSALSLDPENQAKYKLKADEWKARRGMLPAVWDAQEIIPRTPDEISGIARQMDIIAAKHAGVESKWSGKVIIDDTIKQLAYKDWSCDIVTRPETSHYILLHELLHARSASHFTQKDFIRHQMIEEGSTEFLAQEISVSEKIAMEESKGYRKLVSALRGINKKAGLFETDLDFAKALFAIPMIKRLDWLNSLVQDKMLPSASIQQYNEVSKLLDMLVTEVKP